MSLSAREVIGRACRLNGSIASGDDPTAEELADAMTSLNTMVRAMFGVFIGPRLGPLPAQGSAWQAENGGEYQVVGGGLTLTAPLNPRAGARFGVVDATASFGVAPVTIAPNGRLIQGGAGNLVLNTAGAAARWWYRGDTGNWVLEADLASPDVAIGFPDPLIAYLPYMLAVVMGPEYGTDLRQDVIAAAAEGRQAFARAYGRRARSAADPPIGAGPPPAPPQQGR